MGGTSGVKRIDVSGGLPIKGGFMGRTSGVKRIDVSGGSPSKWGLWGELVE